MRTSPRRRITTAAPTAREVSTALRRLGSTERAVFLARFFKTAPGEYAHGDQLIGVSVPQQRALAKRFAELPPRDLRQLLTSAIHEERLIALFIMVDQYRRGTPAARERLHRLYLSHTRRINNWDLVDSSAEVLVGRHIAARPRPLLRQLVRSRAMWERRIAMIATFHFIKAGDGREALWVAEQLLRDEEDLIHKAAGWMLREVGKRVDAALLRRFLDRHAAAMPRTMLRYAIEHLPAHVRRRYLAARAASP